MICWVKNRKNTQRTGKNACNNCIAGGWFRTISHGPQTRMAPQVLRAGEHPWVACLQPKHQIFYAYFTWSSRTIYVPCKSQTCVNAWEITRHALWVRTMFRRIFNCAGAVYPAAEGWACCPFGWSAGPYRCRTGFITPYGQSCGTVWGKYKYERLSDHSWLSTGPTSSEAHLWKLYMLNVQPRAILTRTGPKIIEKSYKPAARSSVVSDQSFRYALNWQRRTQRFFIRTAESNKLSWAHMPFRFCRAQVHISQLLRNFITIGCFHETNRIKISCFEA